MTKRYKTPNCRGTKAESRIGTTCNITAFGEFSPATVRFAKKQSPGFMVWFDKETFLNLIGQAYGQQIAPTVLVRDWVLERLQKQKEKADIRQKELGLGERGWET